MSSQAGDSRVVDKLVTDATDFFLGRTQGNLWPYIYGSPEDEKDPVQGGTLYNDVLEGEDDYYLYKREAELFQNQGSQLTSHIAPHSTFIELGPGSAQSLQLKTIPLLKTCQQLDGYVGIDISQSFLDKGAIVMREAFPDIHIQTIQKDFTLLKSLPQSENTVILFKGSTVGNFTRDEVPTFISFIKELMNREHHLLIVHDSNQDEASLMKAYDTASIAAVMKNVMYRLKRDLQLEMDPGAFSFKPQWHPDIHDLKHVLTATKPQQFDLKGTPITIEEGQQFHILSSFKYPVQVFQDIFSATGYEPIDFCIDSYQCMAAHLFRC